VVAAEKLITERGCGTLCAFAEDVPAGLDHGYTPPGGCATYLINKELGRTSAADTKESMGYGHVQQNKAVSG
jgi:hypothetical protein